MTKKISIATILMIGWFFCLGSNMLFAKEYTNVKDILLDGKDAIGKRATLCLDRPFVFSEDYRYGAYSFTQGELVYIVQLSFRKKHQKELLERLQRNSNGCIRTSIEIFGVDENSPLGTFISIEE